MSTMIRFIAVLSLLCVCGLASKSSAVVVINFDLPQSTVSDGSTSTVQTADGNPAIALATLPGYSSTTVTSFSTIGNSASISGSFIQSRLGNELGYSFGNFE